MTRILSLIVTFGLATVLVAQTQISPEALLKGALQLEQVDGNDAGAIAQYKSIVEKFPANHAVAAQALLQLAGLYERHGQRDEARSALQELLADHATGGAPVAIARERLKAMQGTEGPFKMTTLDAWVAGTDRLSPSPDGKYLSYYRNSTCFLRDLAAGRESALIEFKNGESGTALRWSPDSRYAAFNASAKGVDGADRRIVTIATKEVHTLGKKAPAPVEFVWSADSRRLATVTDDKGTWIVHVSTLAGLDELTIASPPTEGRMNFAGMIWSPDSARIATVASFDSATFTVQITTIATKASTTMAVPRAGGTGQTLLRAWTPNNDIEFQQAVPGGNDYFLVNANGGTPRKICEGRVSSGGDGCQFVSPDGQWIVTRQNESGGGRIAFRSITGASDRTLTPEAVWEQTQPSPGFSPDGRLFAFRSNRDGAYGLYVVPFDRVPLENPVRITALESEATDVNGIWTPNGLIVRLSDFQTNQYRINLDPQTHRPVSGPIRLTEDSPSNVEAFVSPDGRRIAYRSLGRSSGFAVMDANGARERIVHDVAIDRLRGMRILGWTSATTLVYEDPGPSGRPVRAPNVTATLVTLDVSSSQTREIGKTPVGRALKLAGGDIFFMSPQDVLERYRLTGERVRELSEIDLWSWVPSPDGHFLAYATVADAPKDKPAPGDLRLRNLDTGSEGVLLKYSDTKDKGFENDPAPLGFTADGKFLLFREPSLAIHILNLETLEHWPLLTAPPQGIDFDYAAVSWAPDGSFVVLEGRSSKSTWRRYDGVTYAAVTKLIGAGKK